LDYPTANTVKIRIV